VRRCEKGFRGVYVVSSTYMHFDAGTISLDQGPIFFLAEPEYENTPLTLFGHHVPAGKASITYFYFLKFCSPLSLTLLPRRLPLLIFDPRDTTQSHLAKQICATHHTHSRGQRCRLKSSKISTAPVGRPQTSPRSAKIASQRTHTSR
jgi:hypothetical protein